MDQRLNKIETKIDKLDEKVEKLVVTTATNSIVLDEHMRRSDALEKRNDLLEQSIALQREEFKQAVISHKEELHKELAPIKTVVDRVKFSAVLLMSIVSIIATLKHLGLF